MNAMKNLILIVLASVAFAGGVYGQNYSSTNNGSWTSAANWSNTSGWGNNTPAINGSHGSGTANVNHDLSISGTYTDGSATVNVNAGKTLTIYGNMILNGGSNINVYGTLHVTGNVILNGNLRINPGGTAVVDGSVQVNGSNYLTIGTSSPAGPPQAKMVIYQNLNSLGSGDITINKNGWLALFGAFSGSSSGGTVIKINDGGQMYVNSTTRFSGGGDHLTNNNDSSPWGFYTDNPPTYTGGGSNTNGTAGSNAVSPVSAMQTQNPDFYNWIASVEGSPLPVTLAYFRVNAINASGIMLGWETTSELNFDHFEVQRSIDGITFETIAEVQGHGTTNEVNTYSFTDSDPLTGLSYYRLVSVDFDNYSEVFEMIPARFEGVKEVSVYPIPVTDNLLNVKLNFVAGSDVVITVADMAGTIVASDRIEAGSFHQTINLSLNPGVYVVRIAGEVSKVMRVIVR